MTCRLKVGTFMRKCAEVFVHGIPHQLVIDGGESNIHSRDGQFYYPSNPQSDLFIQFQICDRHIPDVQYGIARGDEFRYDKPSAGNSSSEIENMSETVFISAYMTEIALLASCLCELVVSRS